MLLALAELPTEEAAALEQRVASDPALRQQLQSIRQNLAATDAAFDALDDVRPAMVERAASRAAESVWQWQLQHAGQKQGRSASRTFASRWMLPAAAAAVALLIGGTVVVRNWKHHDNTDLANSNPTENNLPAIEHEERTYDDRALDRLAFESWDEYEHPGAVNLPSILPPPVTPPVAAADENPETIGVASVSTGEPFFNVPLSADPEPTP
jgi:hypothetical protein